MSPDPLFKSLPADSVPKSGSKSRTRTRTTTAAAKPKIDVGALREPIINLYESSAFFVGMYSMDVGKTITQQAGECADAWIELARRNEAVAKMLHRLTSGASLTAIVAAHYPIIMAVMMDRANRAANIVPEPGPEPTAGYTEYPQDAPGFVPFVVPGDDAG